MSLQAPNLDDRRFQDIVDETKLLIPKYCPEWTNHNLSDPGVALIELFAWMSEMLMYRINQVPDRFYTKFLELMGIAPFPPTAAQADLTFWLSAVLDQPVTVKAGTQVGAPAASKPVVFETIEDLVIAPPRLIAAKTGRGGVGTDALVDAWEDLRFARASMKCFTSEPRPLPGDAFYFGFAGSLGGSALRFRVTTTSPAGIGIHPQTPPLAVEAWSGEAWATVLKYSDTTGGLNRDGEVILLFPRVHEALALGGTRAYWFRVVMMRTPPGAPTYQASPEIRTVTVDALGGTTTAEHSVLHGPKAWAVQTACPGSLSCYAIRRYWPAGTGNTCRLRPGIWCKTGKKWMISPAPHRMTCTTPWTPVRARLISARQSGTPTGRGTSMAQYRRSGPR